MIDVTPNSNNFTLLPAIDVQNGQAVRLVNGELGNKTNYGTPLKVAEEFTNVYNQYKTSNSNFWVHLVDLNAAFGDGNNYEIIAQTVKLFEQNNINVELSGGIRDSKSLETALHLGVSRVNIGTAALENPQWTLEIIKTFGSKIGIGLDVRGDTLVARGWVREYGNIWDTLTLLLENGAKRFVVTDVTKDGTLQGINIELLKKIADFIIKFQSASDKKTERDFIMPNITASGGVSSINDLLKVKELSTNTSFIVDSVIFGKAMYSGQFTLSEAIEKTIIN